MKVNVDTKLTISPNEQVLLEYFRKNDLNGARKFLNKVDPRNISNSLNIDYMSNLKNRGYVEAYTSNLSMVSLTDKGKGKIALNVEPWIDEYRFKFPKNKKGDRKAVIKKMTDFLLENDNWGKDIVLNATDAYLSTQMTDMYVSQADYFILKNNQSKLYQYCEDLQEVESGGNYEDLA